MGCLGGHLITIPIIAIQLIIVDTNTIISLSAKLSVPITTDMIAIAKGNTARQLRDAKYFFEPAWPPAMKGRMNPNSVTDTCVNVLFVFEYSSPMSSHMGPKTLIKPTMNANTPTAPNLPSVFGSNGICFAPVADLNMSLKSTDDVAGGGDGCFFGGVV